MVNGMLLASLQEKARKWRKTYECTEEDTYTLIDIQMTFKMSN